MGDLLEARANGVIYVAKDQTVCRSADFTDIGKFLIFNYLIHAFTVVSYPGERASKSFLIGLTALLVPGIGLKRAAEVIYQAPILLRTRPKKGGEGLMQRFSIWVNERMGRHEKRDDDYSESLALAHAAGALCTIVTKEEVHDHFSLLDIISFKETLVHGRYALKPGEGLLRVPRHVPVRSLPCPGDAEALELSTNTNILKSTVAICQVLYSAWELYSARGKQFDHFGYASYSLTTIPYALMSLVNLWATVLSPQYPCVFLVKRETSGTLHSGVIAPKAPKKESDPVNIASLRRESITIITESPVENGIPLETPAQALALGRIDTEDMNARMSGAVGVLDIQPGAWPRKEWRFHLLKNLNRYAFHAIATYLGVAAFLCAPYVIIELLTGYGRQQSTHSQRVWVIIWIVTGQIAAIRFLEKLMPEKNKKLRDALGTSFWILQWCAMAPSIVSAIGGYVVVIKMIQNFGVCVKM